MERLACIRRDSLGWLAGTAWHSLEVVDKLEQRTGKPVVTSNQALVWAAFRKAGVQQPIHGYGKLLE